MKTKKILNMFILFITVFMIIFNVTYIQADATANIKVVNNKVVLDSGFDNQDEAFSHVMEKYKTLISFFSAMAAITMVGIFIFNFTKLGTVSGNPQERQKCITGLIISAIAAALLGSVSLFMSIFYGAFRE